ncbi:LpxD N-terminal domain-containing protein, partial [Luteibacter sp.]|uniref:LpxD N-terminal domain-containing protein n=1 Tax=Luteibacter sp. TaxID=1886636 RepID=UPI003F80D020
MSGNPHYTLAELAERFGLEAHGDPSTTVDGVGTLAAATSSQFTFLSNPKYTSQLAETQAGIVVLNADALPLRAGAALVAKDPYVAYAKIAALFEHTGDAPRGIHASAVVAPSARVHPTASIGPCCVVEDGAVIEEGAILGPHCTIGP